MEAGDISGMDGEFHVPSRSNLRQATNILFKFGRKIQEWQFIPLRLNFLFIIYNNLVRTWQETHYVSATKPSRLMLFRETVAVYSENHMEHTNTLCGQNAEIFNVQVGGT
jgi:hypothetical protein